MANGGTEAVLVEAPPAQPTDRYSPASTASRKSINSSSSKQQQRVSRGGGRKVAPEVMGARNEKSENSGTRRTKSSSRKNLRVDTSKRGDPPAGENRRSCADQRSSGAKKTSASSSSPDFITQTDKYGNATTPRSEGAISVARRIHPSGPKPHLHVTKKGTLSEEDTAIQMDACAETLLDSIRLMCCCMSADDSATNQTIKSQDTEEASDDGTLKLLPSLHPDDKGKKCLVLDLDETLVHSSFRAVPGADFVIPVQIEDVVHFVYVAKRPGVDEFLLEMSKYYEIVIYTASLNKYADPLLDLLDPHQTIRARLFRESCVYYEGNYVKDLSLLDRDLTQTIIVDNSPSSYIFHPENAIDCSSFIDDPMDRELDQIAAFLVGVAKVKDVRMVCHKWREWPRS